MRYRLRTLLIVLALMPPLLSGGWFAARNAALLRPGAPSPSFSYCVSADCTELPPDDKALHRWLRAYPNVQAIGVRRNGKSIEIIWGTSGNWAEQLGDRPIADLRAEFDRLGYKGVTRFDLQ
jgi:hypothetical protein